MGWLLDRTFGVRPRASRIVHALGLDQPSIHSHRGCLGGGAVIVQVCASGGLKRESNSLAPGLKLRRNQAALASPALAQTDRGSSTQKPDSPAAFLSPTI